MEVAQNDLFKAGFFKGQAKELLEVDVCEAVEADGFQRFNTLWVATMIDFGCRT